jgi:predicted SprT family Zn-dependent metalloprotease
MALARKPKAITKVERTKQGAAITLVEYGKFQEAFDFFNVELFGGRLPHVLVTLQRQANTRGYFGPDKFMARTEEATVSELAMNPDHFTGRTDEQILSTLVHEMTHVCQHAYGKPSRRGYHNKEWATMMKAVGLYPSSTEAVGGKETGQSMSHYIIPGGQFALTYAKLMATGFKLRWQSSVRSNTKVSTGKEKFTCNSCGQNAWGKPDLRIRCDVCDDNPIMLTAGKGVDRTNQLAA